MKKLILLFLVLSSIACASRRYVDTGRKKDFNPNWVYKVYKIDSIGLWNLIYVKHQKNRYKIVSRKEFVAEGMKIKKHKCYNLKLHSIIYGGMVGSGVNCFGLDSTTTAICLERNEGIFDLLRAESLKGLYLIESDSNRGSQ